MHLRSISFISCQTAVCVLKLLVWGLFLFPRITSLTDIRHFLKINRSHENHVSISDSANKNLVGFFFHSVKDLLCNNLFVLYGTVVSCYWVTSGRSLFVN